MASRPARWLPVLLLVLGIGSGMWLMARPLSQAPDLGLKIIDGRTLRLQQLRGRPVLVIFWATTCATCVEEIPRLKALYRELAPAGLEIVAIAMPYDPPNQVLSLQQRLQIPWPIALDLDGTASRAFGDVPATPAGFLINPAGRITQQWLGRLDMTRLAQSLRPMLQSRQDG